MTALDSWAFVGVLCRHVSCRGWNAAGLKPPSVGAFSKGPMDTLLTCGSARVWSSTQERKRFKPRN